jgi:tyrosine-protein phosphatase YwqE
MQTADLHIHLLPGIDDGAKTVVDSMELLRLHYDRGVRRIIATPHIRSDFFANTETSIRQAYDLLAKEDIQARFPELTLSFAAEYFADDYFMELVGRNELLPLFDNYVLIETSMREELPYFEEILQYVIAQGWQPVLAHPERYRQWQAQPEQYVKLRKLGVLFQINLLSLGGAYGSMEQSIAEQLIAQGWVEAVGSDLHRASQYHYLERAQQHPLYPTLMALPLLNHQLNVLS